MSIGRLIDDVPYPFNPEEPASIEAHIEQLRVLRNKAIKNPLTPGFVFNLECPLVVQAGPSCRPLSPILRSGGLLTCELVSPMQTGVDRLSQVWLARARPHREACLDESTLLVVKLVQPSLLRHPMGMYNIDLQFDYNNPEQVAQAEEAFYTQLLPLQGNAIPYFFGMHTICVPSGESAWVLGLEYIEGHNITELIVKPNEAGHTHTYPIEKLLEMYMSADHRLREIHSHGIIHNDIASRNIMIATESEHLTAVFIDADARRCTDPVELENELRDLWFVFYGSFTCCVRPEHAVIIDQVKAIEGHQGGE